MKAKWNVVFISCFVADSWVVLGRPEVPSGKVTWGQKEPAQVQIHEDELRGVRSSSRNQEPRLGAKGRPGKVWVAWTWDPRPLGPSGWQWGERGAEEKAVWTVALLNPVIELHSWKHVRKALPPSLWAVRMFCRWRAWTVTHAFRFPGTGLSIDLLRSARRICCGPCFSAWLSFPITASLWLTDGLPHVIRWLSCCFHFSRRYTEVWVSACTFLSPESRRKWPFDSLVCWVEYLQCLTVSISFLIGIWSGWPLFRGQLLQGSEHSFSCQQSNRR